MKRSEFDKMEDEVKAAMVAVARRYGVESLEFDDYIHFWLEEHVDVTEEDVTEEDEVS